MSSHLKDTIIFDCVAMGFFVIVGFWPYSSKTLKFSYTFQGKYWTTFTHASAWQMNATPSPPFPSPSLQASAAENLFMYALHTSPEAKNAEAWTGKRLQTHNLAWVLGLFIYLSKVYSPVNCRGSPQGFSLNQIWQKLKTIQNIHILQT